MLEEMSLVVREWELDDLQKDDERDGQRDHRRRFFKAARSPLSEDRGALAQPLRAAGNEQTQQHDAGNRRPSKVGAPAQPVIASRFVFVQISSQ